MKQKTLTIRVIPRSSKNEIIRISDTEYKIKLTAPPSDGQANKQLIDFLAKQWKLPKTSILITKGKTGRVKTLSIKPLV